MARMSKTAIDRLGVRLAQASIPGEEDLRQLESLRASYDLPSQVIARQLADLGYKPTMRPMKTTNTIVEKLRRETTMRLSQMQDIAGGRIVGAFDLDEQRSVAGVIDEALQLAGYQTMMFDRRTSPTFGYRAIHVVAVVEGYRIEIQIRTELQHLWAELNEKLGDLWGRGLRYGTEDYEPDQAAGIVTRKEVVANIQALSSIIAEVEDLKLPLANRAFALTLDQPEEDADPDVQALHQSLVEDLETDKTEVRRLENKIREILATMMQVFAGA